MADKAVIAVVGAGRMGRGIAHMFSSAGSCVTLLDLKEREPEQFARLAEDAFAEVETNMRYLESLGVTPAIPVEQALELISVKPSAMAGNVLGGADVIIEGVPETLDAKRHCLSEISRHARPDAIISSTTSTMLVTQLQSFVTRPERFLNTHFLNPAYLIPLVELSAGPVTSERTLNRVTELFDGIGKVPVRCSASPGFIVPRLQALLLSEACRMVEEGVANPEDIDKAIMSGFGPRYATMGVLEFLDWGGVEILLYAGNHLAETLNSPRHAPPPQVAKMVSEGRTGLRTGRGYYDYAGMDLDDYQRDKLSRFVSLLKSLGWLRHGDRPGAKDRAGL